MNKFKIAIEEYLSNETPSINSEVKDGKNYVKSRPLYLGLKLLQDVVDERNENSEEAFKILTWYYHKLNQLKDMGILSYENIKEEYDRE